MAALVTGLFKARSSAERAVEDLVAHGWSRDDVSLLMSDATQGREFGLAMATKAPEGAAAGGTIGGVIGAIAAGLIATGVVGVGIGCGGTTRCDAGRPWRWGGCGRSDGRVDRTWNTRARSKILQRANRARRHPCRRLHSRRSRSPSTQSHGSRGSR